jgi:LEA14-like dessication related protein
LTPEPTLAPSLPSPKEEVEERVKEEVEKLTAEGVEEFSNIVGNISIEGFSNRWGRATEESTVIKTEVRVKNDNDIPIYTRRISFAMEMNNITMVAGESQDRILLRPRDVTKVSVESTMDNTRIPEWWASHIKNGEKTYVEINVEITLEEVMGVPVSIPPCYGRSKITIPVAGREIPMACIPTVYNVIETNILGG